MVFNTVGKNFDQNWHKLLGKRYFFILIKWKQYRGNSGRMGTVGNLTHEPSTLRSSPGICSQITPCDKHSRAVATQIMGHIQNTDNVTKIFESHCDHDQFICDRDQYFCTPIFCQKILVTVTELTVTITVWLKYLGNVTNILDATDNHVMGNRPI